MGVPTVPPILKIEVDDVPLVLQDRVNVPANYAFMQLPELTSSARRNLTVMMNIYRCHNTSDFTDIHTAIYAKFTRTDQVARYLKGILTYYQIAMSEEIQDSFAKNPGFASHWTRVVNQATTLHFDDVSANAIPQTKAFLNNAQDNTYCPYYARQGSGKELLLADALMSAAYPVWEFDFDDTAHANPNSHAVIPQLIAVNSNNPQTHVSYTNHRPLYTACGGVLAAGGAVQVNFDAAPPTSGILLDLIHRVALSNNEVDSYMSAIALATQIVYEYKPLPASILGTESLNALLDFDVLSLHYSPPIYRLLQAFDDSREPPNEGTDEALWIRLSSTQRNVLSFFGFQLYGYSRSVALAHNGATGDFLEFVPLHGRNIQLHNHIHDKIDALFPNLDNASCLDMITEFCPGAMAGVFGITLPYEYENSIWRRCSIPVNSRSTRMAAWDASFPYVTQILNLIPLTIVIPLEAGLFDPAMRVNMKSCCYTGVGGDGVERIIVRNEGPEDLYDASNHLIGPAVAASHLLVYMLNDDLNTTLSNVMNKVEIGMGRSFDLTIRNANLYNNVPLQPRGTPQFLPNLEFGITTTYYGLGYPILTFSAVTIANPQDPATHNMIYCLSSSGGEPETISRFSFKWGNMRLMPQNVVNYTRSLPQNRPPPGARKAFARSAVDTSANPWYDSEGSADPGPDPKLAAKPKTNSKN